MSLTMLKAWRKIDVWTSQPPAIANYEAQLWARQNTSEDAVFIVYSRSWRTISLRRTVHPRTSGLYIYSCSRLTKQFDDDILAFYSLETAYQEASYSELYNLERAAYLNLKEADILRLARRLGGDYICSFSSILSSTRLNRF
jgi:hypothetical protein